jgi:pimeloyl-ACP methyl ester carboxylesterase
MNRQVAAGVVAVATLLACRSMVRPNFPERPSIKRIDVNGTTLAYEESGRGVPVVFVHGAFVDLREWEPQRRPVAEHHRYIAYSMRYHWPNAWVGDGRDYSFELHAADLAAFVAGLGAGPVHVVGHSIGGAVALLMALDHPELVRSLTVVEPALASMIADEPEAKPILARRGELLASIRAAVAAGDTDRAEQLVVDDATGDEGHFVRLPGPVREQMRANERTVGLLFGRAPASVPCARLARIQVPTLVVIGERATPFYAKVGEAAARCLPHARLAVLPGGAHTMTFEDPGSFNRVLLHFLAEQAHGSSSGICPALGSTPESTAAPCRPALAHASASASPAAR